MKRTPMKRGGPIAGKAITVTFSQEHMTQIGGVSSVKFTKRAPLRRRSKKRQEVYDGETCGLCHGTGKSIASAGDHAWEGACLSCGGTGRAEGRYAFNQRILAARPWCEAGERIGRHYEHAGKRDCRKVAHEPNPRYVWTRCAMRSEDVHEILARSAGGSIVEDGNVLAVCRACHTWIGDHPREATALGLRKSRYPARNPKP